MMGIQDRDYWRERLNDQLLQEDHGQVKKPPTGGLDWGEKKEPSAGWSLGKYSWLIPFLWGFILGENWDKLKLLGSLFYAKYLG